MFYTQAVSSKVRSICLLSSKIGAAKLVKRINSFDNSGTKKEGVSRTYKGCDGFAPIFAYLGQKGYAAHVEFRTCSTLWWTCHFG